MNQQPTTPVQKGSLLLFRVAGITVSVHWSWLVVAYFEISARADRYASPVWNVAEYVTLFGIVLLHEFGHALACRQVGGKADFILLWPLGGVAYVAPPPRPGAVLWSIAAGPLVNVALVPVTVGLLVLSHQAGWPEEYPNVARYVEIVALMNAGLLIFNLLPIYPLDGGQILQALLWFVIGRVRSLQVVSVIGFIGAFALIALALNERSLWLGVIAVFIALQAASGYRQATLLRQRLGMPRHDGLKCPSCGNPPIRGNYWSCGQCGASFDTFEHRGQCPNCSERFPETTCPECGQRHPIADWYPPPESTGTSSEPAPGNDHQSGGPVCGGPY
jgi:Zn-dependent protease